MTLFLIAEVTSSAAAYKGQSVFVKECKECHDSGQAMAASKKAKVWKRLLSDDGEELATIHTESQKAKASWEYFRSDKFQSKSKHLKDFMMEYSKDSGKVPACN
jgi:mono/diheme cytochrome c family protein